MKLSRMGMCIFRLGFYGEGQEEKLVFPETERIITILFPRSTSRRETRTPLPAGSLKPGLRLAIADPEGVCGRTP
jgi:hypothetical protein